MTKKTTETDDEILQRLSEKVERAIATIQELRRERDELKRRLDEIDDDSARYRKERGQIRDRIESILSSLESLEES
ncbi:MAG TPA: cell division protein ZapB [Thermoanaerobaculia bacterium]|nr:cell division protein ZapB [Thermoanaerobaculia bacterium]